MMRAPKLVFVTTVTALFLASQAGPGRRSNAADALQLKGLRAAVRVVWDSDFIPHVFAENDRDAMLALGYVHARDRFFQMDLLRRQASGTSAELLGRSALPSDIQVRTLGLRRAAEASLNAYPAETRALLEGYADGVNAYVQDPASALPPEYRSLELTRASIPAWTVMDSLVIAKGLAFSLSFFQEDAELSVSLAACQKAGQAGGFDGTTLFFEDLVRVAPFDPTVSIPGFFPAPSGAKRQAQREATLEAARRLPEVIAPETLKLAQKYLEALRRAPLFEGTLEPGLHRLASNWWLIGGKLTDSGYAMLASDPHLSLSTPPIWYEAHLIVSNDPARGPMNVAGVTLPGVPGVVLGCNERVCWGATMNPLDVTDTFQEQIVFDLATLTPKGTVFEGRVDPLVLIPQTYRVNQVGNGVQDDVVTASVGLFEGGMTVLVPRRNNGPIVAIDASSLQNITALSVQYTGWGATREAQTFLGFARARTLEDFKSALRSFTFGSQNWAYADLEGNIAYFTSAELPLREDLETLGRVDGTPPFLIRDGAHRYRNEWLPVRNPQPGQSLPYEILPFEEMPQVVNPPQGFIANANNDPVGLTLENNPLGRRRPGGGIYYLSPGYDCGFRVGRITGLIRDIQVLGGKIDLGTLAGLQANNQLLDAQVFVPYIQAALANARAFGAPSELAALAADGRVAEAVDRLGLWDYSTPTGIREGYDPGDDAAKLPEPSHREAQNSIAATIYSVWRGQILRNTIDATLRRLGLQEYLPPDDRSLAALRNLLEKFPVTRGRGASGVSFFEAAGAPSPEAARDILILRSLREALNLLSGDAFAPAFSYSTRFDDYRWGKLHRIVFRHALGGALNIPPAGGFPDLGPRLPGLARAGGFEVLDASGHDARAASAGQFMFGSGPSRRFVGELAPGGIRAYQIIPGGQSGFSSSPAYSNMLGRWLTNSYHPLRLTPAQVETDRASEERFTPAP
jgi:penicillin amidase